MPSSAKAPLAIPSGSGGSLQKTMRRDAMVTQTRAEMLFAERRSHISPHGLETASPGRRIVGKPSRESAVKADS